MTPAQVILARNALGLNRPPSSLSRRPARSYRNRYVTPPDGPAFDQWQDMVSRFEAEIGQPVTARSVLFRLTRKGALLALSPGESLCPEDFPLELA